MTGYSSLIGGICEVLEQHGGGLSIGTLAKALDAHPAEVRRQVEAYADLETAATLEEFVGDTSYLLIEPADPYADGAPPSDEDLVTLNASAREVLGIEQFDAVVLGPLYQSAERLLVEEPDNQDLRDAAVLLRKRFLPGIRRPRHFNTRRVGELGRAIREHRRVRIIYSRAWQPGVSERVIEPYAVHHTSRGAEVDAGPVDEAGQIRTFLVNRIRELTVLEETFERPQDAEALSASARQLTDVSGYVTHAGRWAVEKWAESFTVTDRDEAGVAFVAQVLPPVEWRSGLMMLLAGPGSRLDDRSLDQQRAAVARRLLAHHGLID